MPAKPDSDTGAILPVCWERARVPACDVSVSLEGAGRGGQEGGEPRREGPRILTWKAQGVRDLHWCGAQAW